VAVRRQAVEVNLNLTCPATIDRDSDGCHPVAVLPVTAAMFCVLRGEISECAGAAAAAR